jgi:hypothetical protein
MWACTGTFEIVATNSGNEDLEISEVALTDDQGFLLEDGDGGSCACRSSSGRGNRLPIDLLYTPGTSQQVTTTLEDRLQRRAVQDDERPRAGGGRHRARQTR